MLLRYSLQLEAEARALEGGRIRGHRRRRAAPPISPLPGASRLRRAQLQMRCWLRFSAPRSRPARKIRHQIRGIFDAHRDPQQSRR